MMTSYGGTSSMSAAPILTSSAVTSAPRRWTSSTNAGGNDHSRPTMSPMRWVMSSVLRSIVASDVQSDHSFPVGPVVGPSVPDPKRVTDALVPQRGRQAFVGCARGVVAADGQDDVLPPERLESAGVVLVQHEVRRVAGVHVGVRVPAGESLHVVEAAHPDDPVDQVRVPEPEADGVVGPEAGAGGDDERLG